MRTIIHRSVKGIVIIAASLLMLSDSPIRLHAEPSFVAPDKGGAEVAPSMEIHDPMMLSITFGPRPQEPAATTGDDAEISAAARAQMFELVHFPEQQDAGYANMTTLPPTQPPQGAVPEPATFALLALGIGGLLWLRRKPRNT